MEDGQQHQAVETAEATAADGAIDEIPTAELAAAPSVRDGAHVTDGATAPQFPPVVAPLSAPDVVSTTRAAVLTHPFGALPAAVIAACCFALVGISYSIAVASGADWTRGAQVAAYAAFALALLALAVGALRYAAGRRALSFVVLALLLSATLVGTGTAGLLMAPSLHRAQARVLEQSGRYEAAIAEYALAGDKAPDAPDTARTYDEWAASLLRQKQYTAALSRYLRVTSTYPGTGSPYHQAEAGVFATYAAWIAVNGSGVPYPDAIEYIQTYMKSPACDAACQSTAKAILPQAAYQFGTQLTAAGQYAEAVKQLAAVKTQYPQSPYAAQAHTAAAVAYLDLGQQQLPTACGDAVKTYQALAKSYADTPQGAQAKKALDAPQRVTGTIAHVPSNPAPTMYLSRSADPVSYYFSNDFHTSVDSQSGSFTFANVPLGTYFLSAVRDTADGSQTIWWNAPDGSIYTVQVGPLCGAQLPTFTYG
ncbi:MAG TPA: hypothetical protein VF116_11860 [Ktedonobacterales bacterium]